MRWALSIPGELILRAGVWLDPGITPCVKTHTIAKCRKYNSPTRYRTSCAQHDSTPWCAISSRCFYVCGGRWSFRTAKTQSGHRPDRNSAVQRAFRRCAIVRLGAESRQRPSQFRTIHVCPKGPSPPFCGMLSVGQTAREGESREKVASLGGAGDRVE